VCVCQLKNRRRCHNAEGKPVGPNNRCTTGVGMVCLGAYHPYRKTRTAQMQKNEGEENSRPTVDSSGPLCAVFFHTHTHHTAKVLFFFFPYFTHTSRTVVTTNATEARQEKEL
jgi:hypothetical protein